MGYTYKVGDKPSAAQFNDLAQKTDLAASGGAGLVGYIDDAPGSVATTVQAILRALENVIATSSPSKGYFGILSYDGLNSHIADSGGVYVGGLLGLLLRHEGFLGDEGSLALYPQTVNRAGRISICPSGLPGNMNGADTSSLALQLLNGASEERFVLVAKAAGEYRLASFKSGAGAHHPITIWNADEKLLEVSTSAEVIVTRSNSGNTSLGIENTDPTNGKRWYLLSKTNGQFELFLNGIGASFTVDPVTRNIVVSGGSVAVAGASQGFRVKEGTNCKQGRTAALVAGSLVVSNTAVTASSRIFLNRATAGGTLGHISYTVSAGVSFTITSSSATETSTFDFQIFEPA